MPLSHMYTLPLWQLTCRRWPPPGHYSLLAAESSPALTPVAVHVETAAQNGSAAPPAAFSTMP